MCMEATVYDLCATRTSAATINDILSTSVDYICGKCNHGVPELDATYVMREVNPMVMDVTWLTECLTIGETFSDVSTVIG